MSYLWQDTETMMTPTLKAAIERLRSAAWSAGYKNAFYPCQSLARDATLKADAAEAELIALVESMAQPVFPSEADLEAWLKGYVEGGAYTEYAADVVRNFAAHFRSTHL